MWQCKRCGESVDDDFELCWNCCADQDGVVASSVPDAMINEPWSPYPKSIDFPAMTTARSHKTLACLRLFRSWVCHRSCVVIGLSFQVTLILLYLLLDWLLPYTWFFWGATTANTIALFLPGSVKRWKATHLFLMGGLGAVATPLTSWLLVVFRVSGNSLWDEFAVPASVMVLLGVGEWLLRPGDSMRRLGWIGACCLGAAGGYSIIAFFVSRSPILMSVRPFALPPLLVVAAWLAIAAADRIAAGTRQTLLAGYASVALLLGGFFFTYHIGIYELAKISLTGGGVFSRDYAVVLLAHRGRDSDYELIVEQLHRADWTEPSHYPPGGGSTAGDWRETAVERLIRHDAGFAAERLAALLLEQPSRQLIDMTDGLFVEQNRYETVPIFMRYALVESTRLALLVDVNEDRLQASFELEVLGTLWCRIRRGSWMHGIDGEFFRH